MESLIAPIASGVISAIVAAFGCYVAITNQLTELRTQQKADREQLTREIQLLREETSRHNQLVERTYKVESDVNTAFKRIDEHRDRIERLESIKIGGTD